MHRPSSIHFLHHDAASNNGHSQHGSSRNVHIPKPVKSTLSVHVALLLLFSFLGFGCTFVDTPQSSSTSDVLETEVSEITNVEIPTGDSALDAANTFSKLGLENHDPLELSKITTLTEPVAMTSRAGSPNMYVAERQGIVRFIVATPKRDKNRVVTGYSFRTDNRYVIDIRKETNLDGERGLLGIAFSSDGRKLYANYTDNEGSLNIVEYTMGDDLADKSTRRALLKIEHPHAFHNGGQLAVGPDGFLYIGIGDGTPSEEPSNPAQDVSSYLGKILRIDPEGASENQAYTIPRGNPFVADESSMKEIWSYGLRNPWKFSWDMQTKDLWIADVGQSDQEEINFLPEVEGGAGRNINFGWNLWEGTIKKSSSELDSDTSTPPIFTYDHQDGACAITGGYVYRGQLVSTLNGSYIYGDYCTGKLYGLVQNQGKVLAQQELGIQVEPNTLVSFGQDNDGELWVASSDGGIYRLQKLVKK